MGKRYTQEDFIEMSLESHGDKYDYSKTVFSKMTTHVEIKCPVHGYFKQIARSHAKGFGCRACATEKTLSDKLLKYDFKRRSKGKFEDKFDYGDCVYSGYYNEVTIRCKIHDHLFTIEAGKHLESRLGGCSLCLKDFRENRGNRLITEDEVWARVRDKHGDTYTYKGFLGGSYQGVYKSVLIITCPRHGDFTQLLSSHLHGYGCRFCGYDKSSTRTRASYVKDNKYSHIYLLKLTSPTESFLKVGLTVDIDTRLRHMSSELGSDFNIELIRLIKMTAGRAWDFENVIHNSRQVDKYMPKVRFGGYTECYNVDNMVKLTDAFERLALKYGELDEK